MPSYAKLFAVYGDNMKLHEAISVSEWSRHYCVLLNFMAKGKVGIKKYMTRHVLVGQFADEAAWYAAEAAWKAAAEADTQP